MKTVNKHAKLFEWELQLEHMNKNVMLCCWQFRICELIQRKSDSNKKRGCYEEVNKLINSNLMIKSFENDNSEIICWNTEIETQSFKWQIELRWISMENKQRGTALMRTTILSIESTQRGTAPMRTTILPVFEIP